MREPIRAVLTAAVMLLAPACATVLPAAEAVDPPPFPECDVDAFAFSGETSLVALGLADLFPDQASRTGEIWVTAKPNPGAFDMPPGMAPMDQRLICVEFADGSGMVGPIDDAWQPPGNELLDVTEGSSGVPLGPIAVLLAVAVVVVGSVLAFRSTTSSDR